MIGLGQTKIKDGVVSVEIYDIFNAEIEMICR